MPAISEPIAHSLSADVSSECADLRLRWILALESGTYPQGLQALHGPSGYCCLGVACDIFDPSRWMALEDITFESYYRSKPMGVPGVYPMAGSMPSDVREAYGLSNEEVGELVKMNDGLLYDFDRIAAELRSWWGLPAAPQSGA